jgi:hypothetical protein
MCSSGSVTSSCQYEYCSLQNLRILWHLLRIQKQHFMWKCPENTDYLIPNVFENSSVTKCAWIGWVYLSSFYAKWCKIDWDIWNSLKIFQNKKISSASLVLTLAVNHDLNHRGLVLKLIVSTFALKGRGCWSSQVAPCVLTKNLQFEYFDSEFKPWWASLNHQDWNQVWTTRF